MLLPDPLVGDGHLPAGEIDELRPELGVLSVEGSASRCSVAHGGSVLNGCAKLAAEK
jgi:hypothetical protein